MITPSKWRSCTSVIAILCALAACNVENELVPEAVSKRHVEQIVMNWLECEECQDRELEAVVALGEDALPTLGQVYLDGPDQAGFLASNRDATVRNLRRSYRDLSDARNAHAQLGFEIVSETQYVQRYLDNLDARYRSRSAIAIRAIGGPEAAAILSQNSGQVVQP